VEERRQRSFNTSSTDWRRRAGQRRHRGLNQAGTYTVSFPSSVTNHRLLARAGTVTLDLGGKTYTLDSYTYEGSLIVGKYSGNNASLTVTGGR